MSREPGPSCFVAERSRLEVILTCVRSRIYRLDRLILGALYCPAAISVSGLEKSSPQQPPNAPQYLAGYHDRRALRIDRERQPLSEAIGTGE